jgi:hypothetical protein
LLSIPFSKGAYAFGSKVSVCAMPPAIHNKITVSAFESITGSLEHELRKLAEGIVAAKAAALAELIFLMNSLLVLICGFSIPKCIKV